MDRVGLLLQIFPELEDLKGVDQNGYHHLDVFNHSLTAVCHLEEVLAEPPRYFGELAGGIGPLRRNAAPGRVIKVSGPVP